MAGIVLVVLIIIFIFFSVGSFLKKANKSNAEIFLLFSYIISLFVFAIAISFNNAEYYTAIDPVDQGGYTPLAREHIFSMLFYFIMYNVSAYFIWYKGRKLPPLFLVICLLFIFIGIIINVFLLIQISGEYSSSVDAYFGFVNRGGEMHFGFCPAILLSIVIGVLLIMKVINNEKEKAAQRTFKNSFLNTCNQFLSKRYTEQFWAVILLLPFFILITIILILFGQDYNSMVKVFTDTATWTFSQQIHPPFLDHKGHYLCTVSAKGTPKIVKPIRLGKRHGNIIIVNRQLQIANAFEEMITDISPRFHRFIRKQYDNYGYNLSTKINTKRGSDITYILMKPLEWFFLICLYLGVEKPELKIKSQYS